MATYVFGPFVAYDPTPPGALVKGAAGKVYATTDTAFATPLSVTDMAGVAMTDIFSSAEGVIEEFKVVDHSQVVWKSGSYVLPLTSDQGLKEAAESAASAAQASATAAGLAQLAAEEAQEAVEDLIESGGGGGGGVSAHSALSGLLNDDHPQYFNQARGDARYYTKGETNTAINNATTATSAADRARGNHTGEQAQSTVTGLVAALTNRLQAVVVSTGSEARPTGSAMVLWVGGATQPVNMAITDVWLASDEVTPPADSTPPSVPTGLSITSITATSASVSWSPSSDNVGVTGYDVQVDGVSVGTPAASPFALTDLDPETEYSVRVRARDAVPNWSALSAAQVFSTPALGEAPQHSIFGASAHPGTLNVTSDSPITLATAFYTSTSGANGWATVGGRLYVPVGASVPTSCQMSLWIGTSPDLAATPERTATLTGITAGQWNEVEWPTPYTMTPGAPVWVGYRFAEGLYLSAASVGADPIQSGTTALLFEAGQSEFSSGRSRFHYDGGGTAVAGGHYLVDITVEEAA